MQVSGDAKSRLSSERAMPIRTVPKSMLAIRFEELDVMGESLF
jgi:hypothetical protein